MADNQDTHSKLIGYLLWIFGFLGSHRFYYGKPITGTMSSEPALRRVTLLKQLPDRRQQAIEAVSFGGGLNLFEKLLNPLAGAKLPAVLPVA